VYAQGYAAAVNNLQLDVSSKTEKSRLPSSIQKIEMSYQSRQCDKALGQKPARKAKVVEGEKL